MSLTLIVLSLSLVALQDDDPTADATVLPSDPIFRAERTDGDPVVGRIARLQFGDRGEQAGDGVPEPGLTIVPADGGGPLTIPIDRLVTLDREGKPPAWPPVGALLVLPEGDRLLAIPRESDGATLLATSEPLPDLGPIPLDRVLGIAFAPPSDPSEIEALMTRLRDQPRDADALWRSDGDRLNGSFLGLDPEADAVRFDSGAGPAPVARSGVSAVGFDPALVGYPDPDGPYLELSFLDGSRLGVATARLADGRVEAHSRLGPEIGPKLDALVGFKVIGGAAAYLSEREPVAAQYVPYLDEHPESFGRDSTWQGEHFRLDGRPRDRGLGMLPRTLLAYRIEPGDRRFRALVGLDDRAGPRASVVFRVLLDKREAFASPTMTRRDDPVPIDLDLGTARLLILIVEFGDLGDVQDSADWADARIIRD